MQRWKNIFFNVSLALNCLLTFLFIFDSRLSLPPWLQVAGRMHPLVLHFPVVLIILYAILILVLPVRRLKADEPYSQITDLLLLLASLSAVITALMGIFLSREPGYDPEALQWHKWAGLALSLFTLAAYYFRNQLQAGKWRSSLTAVLAIFLVIFTGHQGAGITHGQNFLLAPMMPEKKQPVIPFEQAEVFAHMVRPILEAKCFTCHNAKKAKGELVMETEALLLKGGKSGALWDTAAGDLGLLLRRVHLALEEKKHMPPQGKTQLTDEEIEILTLWIRKGADFKVKAINLPATDTLRQLAEHMFIPSGDPGYDFAAADQEEVKKLNTANRIVTEESLHSPALTVSFFNSQLYEPAQLKDLAAIKKQIVSLDLSKMPVKDDDMKIIGGMENLRVLNLSFTSITGASLGELKGLKFLHSLSLAGTQVTAEQLKSLAALPKLKNVYAWNIPADATAMDKIRSDLKNIYFDTGFKGDTIVLKLSPPAIQNEAMIITHPVPLELKHYIRGATIRYTLDGSEPDSIHSPEYKAGQMITGNTIVKAKAYKSGWVSSDIVEANFYRSTYRPDTMIFITPPDPMFKGNSTLLSDLESGESNFRNGGWMGWRQNNMETLMHFNEPVKVQSVTLSTLLDIGGYIFPPASIEIWGGNDAEKMKLLGKLSPPQPTRLGPGGSHSLDVSFTPTEVSYIKIITVPVAKLPAWHPGKGEKGWVFIDEILVN
jgi:uncharacterized membrane protein